MKYLIVLLFLVGCDNSVNDKNNLTRQHRQAGGFDFYKYCNSKQVCFCKNGAGNQSISVSCEFFDTLE